MRWIAKPRKSQKEMARTHIMTKVFNWLPRKDAQLLKCRLQIQSKDPAEIGVDGTWSVKRSEKLNRTRKEKKIKRRIANQKTENFAELIGNL